MFLKTQNNDTVELFKGQIAINTTNTGLAMEEREDQFVLGSQILIKCDLGYKLIGDSIRTCTDNEEWSSTFSSCEPQECPILDHPLFRRLNAERIPINQSQEENGKKRYDFYRNFKYYVEGYTYRKNIVLTCKNNVEIKLAYKNVDEYVSNLTWSCNENGKWEMNNLKLNDTVVEDLIDNRMDNICQESMCPLARVSIMYEYFDKSDEMKRLRLKLTIGSRIWIYN